MRTPLAAWRRLFAIGGAPAASHVVLSRTPSSQRLLEPLAGARVAGAASFEALVRPLDVAAVLARVNGNGQNAASATPDIERERVKERSTQRSVGGIAEAAPTANTPAPRSAVRAVAPTHPASTSNRRSAPVAEHGPLDALLARGGELTA